MLRRWLVAMMADDESECVWEWPESICFLSLGVTLAFFNIPVLQRYPS